MKQRVFTFIILLMSISLIGIISIQVFWIKNAFEMAESQFRSDVKTSLIQVSENLSEKELIDFYQKNYSKIAESKDLISESEIKDFIYEQVDTASNETFIYAQTILEENYRVPAEFFENDSVDLKKIYSKEEVTIIKNQISNNTELTNISNEEQYIRYEQLEDYQKLNLKRQSKVMHDRLPIYKRVSNKELVFNIQQELYLRGIVTPFKYGVFHEGLPTKLQSGYYDFNFYNSYSIPLFIDDMGKSDFQLYVSFPDENKYLMAHVGKIFMLSLLFIIIIIVVFATSLYQITKQKKISEIKTDFINNMTHEFKTPIATINLALDAIKNPKIIDDQDKILRYVQMIRDENKRMHAQVENVLRISKLEKNQLDIHKSETDLHKLIEDAVTHVSLLVDNREGEIKLNLKAKPSLIAANESHLTNVIVNILDNAIKYSKNSPHITIDTVSSNKTIRLSIRDMGIGMSKNAQKSIFEKFYRVETGNVHDVKGHGLGLAYVKKIVEHHNGKVYVESEKGKGSNFIVVLPLI